MNISFLFLIAFTAFVLGPVSFAYFYFMQEQAPPQNHGNGQSAVTIDEPKPPICEKCTLKIKNTIWEIAFKKPKGWGIDNDENKVVEVFSANGSQWYFVENFPSRLAFKLEDGSRVFFDFDDKIAKVSGDSSGEFKGAGFSGTLVRNPENSGFDILYFQLPDKKYDVSVKGVSGEYFDDFLKTISLQK